MLVPGLGGTWEEPGWRGYAVHQLEKGRSRLMALLPLWLIIVVWHIPLFLTGGAEWVDILNMVAGVIVYNWLYHRSGHSVLLVMIIHSMNNAVSGEFFSPMFTGGYAVQQAWMRTLVWGVVAVIVLVANWRWWTAREERNAASQRVSLEPVTGS
jgi:membrane protease YdiL (CAAX protease family)